MDNVPVPPAPRQPTLPPPPPPPSADMRASAEVQAWLRRLEAENRKIGKRNRFFGLGMLLCQVLLAVTVWLVYSSLVGRYAELSNVSITRHPAHQGRVTISFDVVRPGKVHYQRSSGPIEAELIDYFNRPGPVKRTWSWNYTPGEELETSVWFREGMFRHAVVGRFPTARRTDVVLLIDTSASMGRFIRDLKPRAVNFAQRLKGQPGDCRLAVIGFGDRQQGQWLDKHPLTADLDQFRRDVESLARFDGGDFAESGLDALEEALALPLDETAARRFLLVSDASYHDPSQSGAKAADIAARLGKARVVLHVFSRRRFEAEYAKLLGDSGRFDQIERFEKVLNEGRILED